MHIKNDTSSFEKMPTELTPILPTLEWLCTELMEVEVNSKAGASKSERKSDRNVYRSGYRSRQFNTKIGIVHLMVPKLRKGGYVPFFVNDKKKSETILLNIIQDAYTDEISVCKINQATKILGIDYITDEQISNLTFGLKKQVNEFKNRS